MSSPVMHFEIIGKDAIALQKFYADVFGWKLSPPVAEMGNYSMFDNQGKGIGGGIGEGDPRVSVYVSVHDPAAYMKEIEKAGGTMIMPVTRITENVTIGMFKDIAGNIMGVMKA